MICKNEIPLRSTTTTNIDSASPSPISSGVPIADNTKDFKMLGINITNNFEEHNEEMKKKIDRFFDALDNLKVHPEM